MTTYTYILTQPWPIGSVLVPAGLVVVAGASGPRPSYENPFPDLFDYIDALGLLSRVPPLTAQACDTATYQAQYAAWLACGMPPLLAPAPPVPPPSTFQ
jgi:hypothetical protein